MSLIIHDDGPGSPEVTAREATMSDIVERDDATRVLSELSSWLGFGYGDERTTPAEYEKRIRAGVEHQRGAAFLQCAAIVEELSKRPQTRWGAIRTAILVLPEAAEAAAGITRLRALLDEAASKACSNADRITSLEDDVVTLREQNTALSATRAELEEGLRDLVACHDEDIGMDDHDDSESVGWCSNGSPDPLTFGVLRRARFLTKGGE